MVKNTKLAIFDVDGTLFNGNLGVEFVKDLISNNTFSKDTGNSILSWYEKYKSGEVEKSVAVDKWNEFYTKGLTGHRALEIKGIAKSSWERIKGKMYSFPSDLFTFLRDRGYKIVLISGSPIEMVSILGFNYGISDSDIVASTSEIISDRYTGRCVFYPGSPKQKLEALDKYIGESKLEVDLALSLAMGDDERDIELLKRVGFPFAFNPNDTLKDLAISSSINIVSEENVLEIFKVIDRG